MAPRSVFHNREFLKLFTGRLITNIGDSLYFIASMWLVYEVSGSGFLTGVAGALFFLPTAFQFVFGPFVDRVNTRRLLGVSQVTQAGLVLVLPAMLLTGIFSIWVLLVVVTSVSLINQLVAPAQASALQQILPESEYMEASSAFSIAYEGVDLLANATAGFLIAIVGVTVVYLIDAVTFLFAAIAFFSIRGIAADGGAETDERDESYSIELREGFEYLRSSVIFPLIVPSIVGNFAIGAAIAVLPMFAGSFGSAASYGLLYSAMGSGMLIGSLLAPFLETYRPGPLIIGFFFLSTIVWVLAIVSPWIPLLVVLFGISWIAPGVYNVIEESIILKTVPENKIARVKSFTMSISMASIPIGSLVGGALVGEIGARATMLVLSGGFGFITIFFLSHTELRQLAPVQSIGTQTT